MFRPLAACLVLLAAIAALATLHPPQLELPNLAQWSSWGPWYRQREPLDALAALMRPVAMAILAAVLLAVVVGAVPARASAPRLSVIASRTMPRWIQLLGSSLAAGTAAVAVAPLSVGALSAAPTDTAEQAPSSDVGAADTSSRSRASSRVSGAPTMSQLDPTAAVSPEPTSTAPASTAVDTPTEQPLGENRTWLPWAEHAPTDATRADVHDQAAPGTPVTQETSTGATPAPAPTPSGFVGVWTVQPGDHFWNIAERVLRLRNEVPADPSEAEIAAYWRRLVSANADRLVEPGNADLIMPGQELVLPQ